MERNNQRAAYLYAGLAVICWSTIASAFKIALAGSEILLLLFTANLTALAVYFIFIVFSGKTNQLFSKSLRSYFRSMLMGLLNPFMYYIILLKAYSLLPAQLAQPLNFIWPVTFMLLAIPMLGHKFSFQSLIALLLSFTGVFFIASRNHLTSFSIEEPAGILLALGSSVIWALYWILNLRDRRDDHVKFFLNFFFSAVYLFIVLAITGNFQIHHSVRLLPAIYIGLFEMGITYIFWLKSLELASYPERITNVIYLTPFLSLVLIHLVLKEKIYITSVVGLFLIVSGIIIQNYKRKETNT